MEAFSSGFVHKTSRIIEERSAFPQSHNNTLSIQIKEIEENWKGFGASIRRKSP